MDTRPSAVRIDPDAYDGSDQQFAATGENIPAHPQPRFVAEEAERSRSAGASIVEEKGSEASVELPDALRVTPASPILLAEQDVQALSSAVPTRATPMTAETTAVQVELIQEDLAASWRHEVAARVNRYRARRRPRGPRYPSLTLKFDASAPPGPTVGPKITAADLKAYTLPAQTPTGEMIARVLEFPRSTSGPPRPLDELAEPVLDGPRILEAPELGPPTPALGGILMDSTEEEESEKRPGFEMPLQPAPMSRRVVAVTIDAGLVLLAFAGFACIFFRITTVVPRLPHAAGIVLTLTAVFWMGYQYLLLVYAGTTPGLRLAKLQLTRFDGATVPRQTRRWRVLASLLSAVSLGLGYAWCLLDEDELCWHDRITRTYTAPRT
jgi:uncharacterized RDD family membrane protein YckC